MNQKQLQKIESGLYRTGLIALGSITDTLHVDVLYLKCNANKVRIVKTRNENGMWCHIKEIEIASKNRTWTFTEG